MIDHYDWRGGRESMLRLGAVGSPSVLVLPPLFEEANRMRRVLIEVMRGLAVAGIASLLPDLPGMNDSPVATSDARFEHWGEAIAALPPVTATVAVRGGALLDRYAQTDAHWRLAPETGARLLRDMVRSTALSSGRKAGEIEAAMHGSDAGDVLLAGNAVHPELYRALLDAEPSMKGHVRAVTLGDGPDALPGQPLWRRAEPGDDGELVAAMVADIAGWVARCAAR